MFSGCSHPKSLYLAICKVSRGLPSAGCCCSRLCSALAASPQLGFSLLQNSGQGIYFGLDWPLLTQSLTGQKNHQGLSLNWNKPEGTWIRQRHGGSAVRLVCGETAACLVF